VRSMLPRALRGLAVCSKIPVGICYLSRVCLRVRMQGVGGRVVGDGGAGVKMPMDPICCMLSCTLLHCALMWRGFALPGV
jgi:hypothetical protein